MAKVLSNFNTGHTGVIHDAQLDDLGQFLATASADGHIRLWDARQADDPTFLADLGGHSGPVNQVVWAPPDVGFLLASASSDGSVLIWAQCATSPGDWRIIHSESLQAHGDVHAVDWAPAEHGAILACASTDGAVTIVGHQGATEDGEGSFTHHWQSRTFNGHPGAVEAVSWAPSPVLGEGPLGLKGARFATVGLDGLRVWRWNDVRLEWDPDSMAKDCDLQLAAHDVAWKPWDGNSDVLAVAIEKAVVFWCFENMRWTARQRVDINQEVWKLAWMEMGSVLMLSCGEDQQNVVLMKQRLGGAWDVMDVQESE